MFACITPALAFGSAAERTPVKTLIGNFFKWKLSAVFLVKTLPNYSLVYSLFISLFFKDINLCDLLIYLVHTCIWFYYLLDVGSKWLATRLWCIGFCRYLSQTKDKSKKKFSDKIQKCILKLRRHSCTFNYTLNLTIFFVSYLFACILTRMNIQCVCDNDTLIEKKNLYS